MRTRSALKRTLMLIGSLTMMFSGGCQNGTAPHVDACAGWSAIYPSSEDVLSVATARQILQHDLFGEKECGWKRP